LGAKQGGVEVNFFGHKALQSPSASILARNFKIDIIPLFISTDNYRDYTLKVYPPLPYIRTENKERDIREMTQAQANIMEQVIREKQRSGFGYIGDGRGSILRLVSNGEEMRLLMFALTKGQYRYFRDLAKI